MGELTKADEKNPLEKLNVPQMKFFMNYIKTGKQIASYRKAFKVKNDIVASAAASRLLKKFPDVKVYMYEKFGIGEADVAKALKDALGAEKQMIYKSKEYVYPDHYARMKAIKLIQDATGQGDGSAKQVGNQLNIIIKKDEVKGIFKVIEGEEV